MKQGQGGKGNVRQAKNRQRLEAGTRWKGSRETSLEQVKK